MADGVPNSEIETPLYDDATGGEDFGHLDLLSEAEAAAAEAENAPGGMVARAVEEQKDVLKRLLAMESELSHMLDEDKAGQMRQEMAMLARSRGISEDDPLWALVDLYVLLYERNETRMRKMVKAALEVGGSRLRLDARIVELLPLVSDASETMQRARTSIREDLQESHKALQQHRADTMTFVEGIQEVFATFKKVADSVGEMATQTTWSRIAERAVIPFLALLLGLLAGRLLH